MESRSCVFAVAIRRDSLPTEVLATVLRWSCPRHAHNLVWSARQPFGTLKSFYVWLGKQSA